jgi:signal transduction histidine kinase
MRRSGLFIAFCFLFLGAALPALSQPTVTLDGVSKKIALEGFLARAEGVSPHLTISEMASPAKKGDFIYLPWDVSGGYTNLDHWYRFTLLRKPGAPGQWILAMGSQVLNEIYVYEPDKAGGFIEHRLGDHGENTTQHVVSRFHSLRLFIEGGEPNTFYVRIRSNSVLSFTATLWQPEALLVEEGRDSFFLGLILGIFVIITVVYGLFGFWLKDGLLVGFAIYVAAIGASHFGVNGFTELLFGNDPAWLNDMLVGCGTITICAAALFILDRLLFLEKIQPVVRKIFLLITAVIFIGNLFVTTQYYNFFAKLGFYFAMPVTAYGLVICWLVMRREGMRATLAVCFAAFFISFVGGSLRIMAILGILPRTTLDDMNFQMIFLVHVILLALSLALRIREMEADRARAHEEARLSALAAEEQRHFVGMLSHEFRAPLADIEKAALTIEAAGGILPDKAKERLERIRGQSLQLGGMVDSFLVAEAFRHGAIALKKEKLRLHVLLTGLVERYSELIPPERLACQVLPPDLEARLDGEMMDIAIGNLIANALRYSPPETPVRVSAEAEIEDGAVCITVADQGAGMSEDEIARMGEMYFRAQSAKGTKGTGLGLHMTKLIIAAHGGDWRIDSRVGEGTQITIRLPQNF